MNKWKFLKEKTNKFGYQFWVFGLNSQSVKTKKLLQSYTPCLNSQSVKTLKYPNPNPRKNDTMPGGVVSQLRWYLPLETEGYLPL